MDDQTTPAGTAATELARIRALLRQREFAAALAASAIVLTSDPDQRDALLFAAIAQRFQGQVSEAQQTLARLAQRQPRYSRLHEELGHCYVALSHSLTDDHPVFDFSLVHSRKWHT